MPPPLTEPELKAAYCWEAEDNVPLNDDSTFASMTLEGLLDSETLPPKTIAAMIDRYLPS